MATSCVGGSDRFDAGSAVSSVGVAGFLAPFGMHGVGFAAQSVGCEVGAREVSGLVRTRLSGSWLLSASVGNVCAGAGGKRRVGGGRRCWRAASMVRGR